MRPSRHEDDLRLLGFTPGQLVGLFFHTAGFVVVVADWFTEKPTGLVALSIAVLWAARGLWKALAL